MGLGDPVVHGAHVGSGIVGFGLIRIPEGIRNPVVEILNGLVVLLLEVLEADAETLSGLGA